MNYTAANQFIYRVIRSVKCRSGHLSLRFKYLFGLRKPSDLLLKIYPWPDLAGLPGNSEHLPWGKCWQHDNEMMPLAVEIISHHFSIFKDQLLDVSIVDPERKALIAKQCPGIDQRLLDLYIPIDWHQDFHSHYRWPPYLFYQDVKLAPFPCVDIKVPRELSRFQHVGALAYGDQKRSSIEFMLQATDWIVSNPYGLGVNWASSMDVALRAINWIWGLRFFEPEIQKHEPFQRLIANSLRDHGRHVYENLDYCHESTGNHYLSDITGLIYIGAVFPDIPESDLWLAFGIQELLSEMRREVLSDGACHEASTHYHRLVAELFVSSAALVERIPAARKIRLNSVDRSLHKVMPSMNPLELSGCSLAEEGQVLPAWFYSKLENMVEFSLALRKPNGFVSQIGDNDSARVHKLMPSQARETRNHDHLFASVGEMLYRDDLMAAGASATFEGKLLCSGVKVFSDNLSAKTRPSKFLRLFPDSGIAVIAEEKAWLCVTCGPSGQGGRGGHGHNDKNSFELNVNGLDFIVDGGCPAYTYSPRLRNIFRSTSMHSTLHVKGLEQNRWSEGIGGLFQLVERANPTLDVDVDGVLEGSHVGYGSVHRRRFFLQRDKLVIDDFFDDDRHHYLTFNFHPDVAIEIIKTVDNCLVFCLRHMQGLCLQLKLEGVSSYSICSGAYGLGYMRPVKNLKLLSRIALPVVRSEFSWAVHHPL